ncbi:hypothetical protein ABPG75_006318 [Micractinium tetrahymenae]
MAAAVAAAAAGPAGDEFVETVAEELSREVFATYTCRSSAAGHGQPHPGDIAEPSSLAAIPLPPTDYPLLDSLGGAVAAQGKLSQLQLEGVMYACAKHLTWLPSGERCGFFIGDGAGVGKGRQISGIILDNYVRGRRKAVWVSTSTDLYTDAVRDLRDLGSHIEVIQNAQALDKTTNTPQEGCLFITYSTLISSGRGRTRLQQLVDWVGGAAFEGVICLDECHKAKNFVPGKEKQSTKVSQCVLELQRQLPRARFVYCSATGVSEVGNLAYMERLGLWGPGAAFPNFQAFLDSMKRRGITFLEMLSMELKGDGLYVSRGLSFREAEFSELECRLSAAQVAAYDAAAQLWQDLRNALVIAVAATGAKADVWKPFWAAQQRFFKLLCVSMKVGSVVKEAKAALEAGYAIVIGLQSTGEAAADSLGLQPGDRCGFISTCRQVLQHFVEAHFPTNKALDDKAAGAPGAAGAAEEEWYNASGAGGEGSESTWQAASEDASPGRQKQRQGQQAGEEDPTSVELKAAVLERVAALDLPPNFLDELVDKLGGPSQVAEMTGRKARVVRDDRGRGVYQLRAKPDSNEMDSLNIKEKQAFMDGRKLVAIVSDAASTGISLHASAVAKNQRRRVHLTIELPWSADKAIQQLGRSHRSNQVSAPLYKLVFTSVGGERRFAAAVARRLQSLGALTRGDRRAASGLDLSELNFDSPLGRKSLRKMYDFIVLSSPLLPPGVRLNQVAEGIPEEDLRDWYPFPSEDGRVTAAAMVAGIQALHARLRDSVDLMGIGLALPRGDTVAEDAGSGGSSGKDVGDVRRFLNRLLGLPVARQNLLFNYFSATLQAEIRAARAEGKYFEGVSDLPGQNIARDGEPQELWVDDLTGLPTLRHDLTIDRGMSFEAARARLAHERAGASDRSGFRASRRPMFGRTVYLLAIQKPGAHNLFSICRPNTGPSYFDMDIDELNSKYAPVPEEEAREGWEAQYDSSLSACMHGDHCQQGAACQVGRRLTGVTILSGSVVRIWDSLERVLMRHEMELSKSDRALRIVRVDFGDGSLPLIGVRYPGHLLPEVVAVLSAQQEQAQHGAGGGAAAPLRRHTEPATPVDPKALRKAFTAPKSITDFFKPRGGAAAGAAAAAAAAANGGAVAATAAGATAGGAAAAAGLKRAPAEAVAAPAAKRQAVKGGSMGAKGGIAAALGRGQQQAQQAQQRQREQQGASEPAPVVDLAADDDSCCAASGSKAAGPTANDVLRASLRHNGSDSSGNGGEGGGFGVAVAKRPGSGGRVDPAAVEVLTAMGFTGQQAERALRVTSGDIERAANWILMGN